MFRCTPNTLVSGLIISPDEPFLVSTPIKVKGTESEKHAFLRTQYSLCRSHVIDDTQLYTYFIGTCIFYSVILGTPLLFSQYVERPEEWEVFFLWVVLYQRGKNKETLNVFWQSESFHWYVEAFDDHTGGCQWGKKGHCLNILRLLSLLPEANRQ